MLRFSFVTHPSPPVSESNTDPPTEERSGPPTEEPSDPPTEEAPSTLYNPVSIPSGEAESTADDTVALTLSLPEERAQRLRDVAKQLGLSPSMIARRAIEMICDEVVTIHDTYRPSHVLVAEYQTRIDLLHAIENEEADAPEVALPDDNASEDNG